MFEIFRTAELVEAVLQGRNGSVFCYGATGAGKTYTMLGTLENPGVMVLAIKDLFTKIRQRSCDGNHVVHLSYLEVYNEMVRDLLSPGRPLVLREDKQVFFSIPRSTSHRMSEILCWLFLLVLWKITKALWFSKQALQGIMLHITIVHAFVNLHLRENILSSSID